MAASHLPLGPDVSGWFSPTDDPDHGDDPDTSESGPQPGQWVVRGVDLATGEVLSRPISDTGDLRGNEDVVSIRDTGTHLIVNRLGWVGSDEVGSWNGLDLPAVVVDRSGEEPAQWELPSPGIASPST